MPSFFPVGNLGRSTGALDHLCLKRRQQSFSGNWHMTESKISNALRAKETQWLMLRDFRVRKQWILAPARLLLGSVILGNLYHLL